MRDLFDDLAWRTWPSVFARRCSLLEYSPDERQCEILDTPEDAILLCTRQFGKSSTAAVKAAHKGATTPGGLIIITAPSERQSIELLLKVKTTIRETDVVQIERESATAMELDNECRYFALPGQERTIKGFSAVDLLLIDEAARTARELFEAVSPMMAVSQGQTILLSSAWYKVGFFYDQCIEENPRWRRFTVTADQCPRITPDFLERERRTTYRGRQAAFRREYFCEFQDLEGAAFDLIHFNNALGRTNAEPVGADITRHSDDIQILFGGT